MNRQPVYLLWLGLGLLISAFFTPSCGGGSGITPAPPGDVSSNVRKAIEQTMALIERGIEEEDVILAANQASDIFTMDGLVAIRFRQKNSPAQPTSQSNISSLLNDFFRDNENIRINLVITDITQNGDLASAEMEFHLTATYAIESPPINYFVDALDRLTFQREVGAWKLIAWEEIEEVEAGDEENPANLEPIVAINRTIKNLEEIINTGSSKLRSKTISDMFSVDPDVGKRFWTPTTLAGGNPSQNFETFFNDVFAYNENIVFTLTVTNWEISEDVATVTVQFDFVATYVLSIPPEVYDVTATDQFNLRLEDDATWRIISWVEAPSGEPDPDSEDICRLAVLNLQEALSNEDLTLVSDSLASGFYLHQEIGKRFRTHVTENGETPYSNIWDYMPLFFSENANIDLKLTLTDFNQIGDVATGSLAFNLNATYIPDVPPTTYTVTETSDRVQFIKGDFDVWQLLYWLPAEEGPAPTDQEQIVSAITGIGDKIMERTPDLADGWFSPIFGLDQTVAFLFPTHHTVEDPPSAVFVDHMNTFLGENANVEVLLTPDLDTLTIDGELCEIEAELAITSDYILTVPPTHIENTARCRFDLTSNSGIWLIYRWVIIPE